MCFFIYCRNFKHIANCSDDISKNKMLQQPLYVGIEKRKEIREDEHLPKVEYRINKKKGADRKREAAVYKEPMKHLEYIGQPKWEREIEYMKSKVRSKVEHIFYIVKRLFGYRKAIYRGTGEEHGAAVYAVRRRKRVEMVVDAEVGRNRRVGTAQDPE